MMGHSLVNEHRWKGTIFEDLLKDVFPALITRDWLVVVVELPRRVVVEGAVFVHCCIYLFDVRHVVSSKEADH